MLHIKNRFYKPSMVFTSVIAALLLIFSGFGYRFIATEYQKIIDHPVALPQPLSTFPMLIGNWNGQDLSIPSVTEEYMRDNFADDFLSRRYVDHNTDHWFDLYVVFCSSKPAGILGHQPLVCYPNNGWILDKTTPSIINANNNSFPCLIHSFHKPSPSTDEIVVLNYYIVGGQITTDESSFSSIYGRRPNISGNIARSVTQVQISSTMESSVIMAAEQLTQQILHYIQSSNDFMSNIYP